MIGSLLYLSASRLNTMFNVFFCARFHTDREEVHLSTIKRIFRCLNRILSSLELKKKFKLYDYSDVDYTIGKVQKRKKSTGRGSHFMRDN